MKRTQSNIGRDVVRIKEKYSRGRRGAPAKGVGRATGARVRIPLSPLHYQWKKNLKWLGFLFFAFSSGRKHGSEKDLKKSKKVVDKQMAMW